MTNEQVKKNLWRNSISNYACMVIKLGMSLLMFRMLYQSLSKEEFGFWSLLWSVFGYGILLDFGFGFTAEKRVAELSATGEWEELSRVLSSIAFLYMIIGLAIVLVFWAGSNQLIEFFHVSAARRENFRLLLILFFTGMGITFPLGIFPGLLIGQQRIALENAIFLVAMFGNFLAVWAAVHFHWGLAALITIGLLAGILPCIVCAFFALRSMPVRIHPKYFSVKIIRETTQFSIFAYAITVSNILMAKTDQLIIGSVLAVAAVAIYQAAAKLGEMFSAFAQLLPSAFSPVAAHLHAKGDVDFLRELLVNGSRLTIMIATPVYLITAFYMEGLLRILTGSQASRETFWIAQVLLLWGYLGVVTQSVTKRIFIMCGHERKLMWLTVSEAAINLGLSIFLTMWLRAVIGVALGSLIATFIIGWAFLWPWAAREARMSGLQLARTVILPVWLACLPLLAFLFCIRNFSWFDFRGSAPLFIAESLLAFGVAGACVWKGALTLSERQHLLSKLGGRFARLPA
ncbi:MAG TPA: oligosaccharide flippase family protein [Verrucomicrobiae bacterium]|jgi:O-antigen/teichoic acid export membrane protein|nr:oligosaccharide flippase family protein [Verrucomicrobiae bacterium]